MFHQQSLFGDPEPPPHTRHRDRPPIAANADPETSRLSAEAITASGERDRQVEAVAEAVRAFPGHTTLELAELSGIDRYTLARRVSEAEAQGLLRRGPAKVQANGRRAEPWYPCEGER